MAHPVYEAYDLWGYGSPFGELTPIPCPHCGEGFVTVDNHTYCRKCRFVKCADCGITMKRKEIRTHCPCCWLTRKEERDRAGAVIRSRHSKQRAKARRVAAMEGMVGG